MRPALPSSYLHNAAALGAAAGGPLPQHVGVAHAAHLPKVVLQVLQAARQGAGGQHGTGVDCQVNTPEF